MTSPLQGKICLITGGTNGIGKSTALALAQMGATIVIVGRNAQKTAQVVQEIRSATHNDQVDALLADLSAQQEIRHLATEFKSRYPRLHILINNAGSKFPKRQVSVDGIEMNFALNHLAYFLLTNLLLDPLIASAPARIVNVASRKHQGSHIAFDDLQSQHSYDSLRAYGMSKLANLLFTLELSRRLEGTGVTANALHPGLVNTGFAKIRNNDSLLAALHVALAPFITVSPEKGAQTSIYLACSPQVEGVSGKYFVDSKITRPAPQALDAAAAHQLWEISAKLVKL